MRLREEREGNDRRNLWVRLSASGDLVIEGQDLGPAVERVLGCREYEWTMTVAAADIPAYAAAIGGRGGDVLNALERRFPEDEHCVEARFLDEHAIPHTLSTRRGD